MPSWLVDFFNGDQATIDRYSEQVLSSVPADACVQIFEREPIDLDAEIERQFHHEVKGG